MDPLVLAHARALEEMRVRQPRELAALRLLGPRTSAGPRCARGPRRRQPRALLTADGPTSVPRRSIQPVRHSCGHQCRDSCGHQCRDPCCHQCRHSNRCHPGRQSMHTAATLAATMATYRARARLVDDARRRQLAEVRAQREAGVPDGTIELLLVRHLVQARELERAVLSCQQCENPAGRRTAGRGARHPRQPLLLGLPDIPENGPAEGSPRSP